MLLRNKENQSLTVAFWILQSLLAALFLFAGGMKLVLPVQEMTKQIALPGPFLRFIGIAEVLGAFGLILPGLFRRYPVLTPLAAAGLVIIMIGATTLTLTSGNIPAALFPLCVGALLGSVVYRHRSLLASHRSGYAAECA